MRPSLSTVILGCSAPAPRVSWLLARSFLHNAPAFMSLCNRNVAIVGSASATPPRRAVAPKAILARRRGFIWWSPTERGVRRCRVQSPCRHVKAITFNDFNWIHVSTRGVTEGAQSPSWDWLPQPTKLETFPPPDLRGVNPRDHWRSGVG